MVLVAPVVELLMVMPVAKALPYTPKSKKKFDSAGARRVSFGAEPSAGSDAVSCNCIH